MAPHPIVLTALIMGLITAVVGWTATRTEAADPITFKLIDQNGRTVTERDFADKPSIVHFGFTRCPAICPTTLAEVALRMGDLGPLASQLNFILVTVDPERDRPEDLKAYVSAFHDDIVALTGGQAEIKALAKAVGVDFQRHELADGDYTMDHPVFAVVMTPGWQRDGVLYMGGDASRTRVMARLTELAGRATTRAGQGKFKLTDQKGTGHVH